jgi:NAD(P) transhydrogenase
MWDFDVLGLDSGPGRQKAAIAAAKLERRNVIDGVCVNTGTISSKTPRGAVPNLIGLNQRGAYGQSHRVRDEVVAADPVNGFAGRKACADVRL